MPGAPFGPYPRSTITLFSSMSELSSSRYFSAAARSSNTRASPVCFSRFGEAAERLTTAPPGARFPFSTAMPPVGAIGLSSGRITSRSYA